MDYVDQAIENLDARYLYNLDINDSNFIREKILEHYQLNNVPMEVGHINNDIIKSLIYNHFFKKKYVPIYRISGPTNITYCNKENHEILLFGESHSTEFCNIDNQNRAIRIYDYLDTLFNNTEVFINFFIEKSTTNINGTMNTTILYGYFFSDDNLKKYNLVNFVPIDIRTSNEKRDYNLAYRIYDQEQTSQGGMQSEHFLSFENSFIDVFNKIGISNEYANQQYDESINFGEKKKGNIEIINEYIDHVYNTSMRFKEIEKAKKDSIFADKDGHKIFEECFRKSFKRYLNEFPIYIRIVIKDGSKHHVNYEKKTFNEYIQTIKEVIEYNKGEIRPISNTLISFFANIIDIYCIYNLFEKNKKGVDIVYMGNYHINFIKLFLHEYSFKLTLISKKTTNVNCVDITKPESLYFL